MTASLENIFHVFLEKKLIRTSRKKTFLCFDFYGEFNVIFISSLKMAIKIVAANFAFAIDWRLKLL
jgi:hypothetical protein